MERRKEDDSCAVEVLEKCDGAGAACKPRMKKARRRTLDDSCADAVARAAAALKKARRKGALVSSSAAVVEASEEARENGDNSCAHAVVQASEVLEETPKNGDDGVVPASEILMECEAAAVSALRNGNISRTGAAAQASEARENGDNPSFTAVVQTPEVLVECEAAGVSAWRNGDIACTAALAQPSEAQENGDNSCFGAVVQASEVLVECEAAGLSASRNGDISCADAAEAPENGDISCFNGVVQASEFLMECEAAGVSAWRKGVISCTDAVAQASEVLKEARENEDSSCFTAVVQAPEILTDCELSALRNGDTSCADAVAQTAEGLKECQAALSKLKAKKARRKGGAAQASRGSKECEAAGASRKPRVGKSRRTGNNLCINAVVQALLPGQVGEAPARRRPPRSKKDAEAVQECDAPRELLQLTQGGGLYTNAVALATVGYDVLQECGIASGSAGLEKVGNSYTDAVAQAARGQDVFKDTGLYLVHADELVSLQSSGIGSEEGDLRVWEDDRGGVPWILARGSSCSTDIFSHFDLELLSSQDIAKLVAGAQPCTQAQTKLGPLSSADQLCLPLAPKGAAPQGVLSGPLTPEIVHDRGRSPSADSVPSPNQQVDRGVLAPGELLRIACSIDGTTRIDEVPDEELMLPEEQGTAPPAAKPPTLPVVQEVQPKAPRKRRYMPKILSEKPKRSRAKKPRMVEAAPDDPSPPAAILKTTSPTLKQMKMLARHKKPQIKRRRYVKRQKRDEATTKVPDENSPAGPDGDWGTVDGRHISGSSQCTPTPLLEELGHCTMAEKSCPIQLDGADCNASSEFCQETLACDPSSLKDRVAVSSQEQALADQGSSSLVPLSKPIQGSSCASEVLLEACLGIPGNVMSSDELRNALDPISTWPDGPPDFGPDEEECLAAIEDHPSTPRGPNPCPDFTLVLSPPSPPPPPSPPSPQGTLDQNHGFPRVSAASTRRTLKFDAEVGALILSEDAQTRREPVGMMKAMAFIAEEVQSPETTFSFYELDTHFGAEESCAESVSTLPLIEPVPLASDSRERRRESVSTLPMIEPVPLTLDLREGRREEELQIVAYDDGSKKMVVYNKPLLRKRRLRFKPKVDLDFGTLKKFKMLMLKGSDEDDTEQDKASWEESRRAWQNRAHQFISIMRQVQGNRSFSRWKGSVVDSVGGAFLTQNVSDFLSSNAFMALRARFPARHGTAAREPADNATPETRVQPPIEEEACVPLPERLPMVELREEASETVAAVLSKSVNDHMFFEDELTELVETLSKTLARCHIEHRCNESLPRNDAVMNQSDGNILSSEVCFSEDRDCSGDEACISGSLVQQEDYEHREGGSPWRGKLAVIQEKFSNVVEGSVSNLTSVGKEKVLAATLRLVLGKQQTGREGEKAKVRALKTVKLRPERALMRKRIDNYRYRQGNVSFRLLSGEARASWEAGYVMKSQKDKWEPLRANILADGSYYRDPLCDDCVDWDAVQRASVHEVADVIKNRGMNNALAGRLKAFLDRVHRDQNGKIDLEWIRRLPPEDAKAFLLSFRGVGLKSVECIRLLTLHHPSFPVDTNVGRIAVRLGWVPLEPLPEETQLHLLDLYPIQSHIQQYMWPRLCTLDQETLYELHYQMITFGKVFCTKSKPNCNACPLRSECKHYASSYASAKLLLKWPEKQDKQSTVFALTGPDPTAQTKPSSHSSIMNEDACIPIIEEPHSPEPYRDSGIPDSDFPDSIPDIEEVPLCMDLNRTDDPAEIQIEPLSRSSFIGGKHRLLLSIEESSLDVSSDPELAISSLPPTISGDQLEPQVVEYEEEEAMELDLKDMKEIFEGLLEDTRVIVEKAVDSIVDSNTVENTLEVTIEEKIEVVTEVFKHLPSQELILLPPHASLAPAPKLKNVQRLRTVHFVYELPDNHPLLFEMDQREADDPCFYLLAIWSPDEVPATMPKINDDDADNPFASCEDNNPGQTVRGTLLIPCKTAMRGWFPLNGTYFQVNEVFADHASSMQPIDVPRTLLWSLRRRFVYFSTAVSNLFKDMSQEEIQCCFQKGYVCLRAFDVATRQPKLLAPRLHQSGAKIVTAPASRTGRGKGRPRKNTPKEKATPNSTNSQVLMESTIITETTFVTQIDL